MLAAARSLNCTVLVTLGERGALLITEARARALRWLRVEHIVKSGTPKIAWIFPLDNPDTPILAVVQLSTSQIQAFHCEPALVMMLKSKHEHPTSRSNNQGHTHTHTSPGPTTEVDCGARSQLRCLSS